MPDGESSQLGPRGRSRLITRAIRVAISVASDVGAPGSILAVALGTRSVRRQAPLIQQRHEDIVRFERGVRGRGGRGEHVLQSHVTDLGVLRGIERRQSLEEPRVGRNESVEVATPARHPVVAGGGQGVLARVGAEEELQAGSQLGIDRIGRDEREGTCDYACVTKGRATGEIESDQRMRLIGNDERALPRVVEDDAAGVIPGKVA